jgi:hypothetical protein
MAISYIFGFQLGQNKNPYDTTSVGEKENVKNTGILHADADAA